MLLSFVVIYPEETGNGSLFFNCGARNALASWVCTLAFYIGRVSLVPRPSPLSAHYTRAGFAHADSYALNCPHVQNPREAEKAWEQG